MFWDYHGGEYSVCDLVQAASAFLDSYSVGETYNASIYDVVFQQSCQNDVLDGYCESDVSLCLILNILTLKAKITSPIFFQYHSVLYCTWTFQFLSRKVL